MKSIKTVLISTASLPHTGVASWTTELNYLLERDNNIDYLIGPYSEIKINKPKQIFIDKINFIDKLKCKVDYSNRFNPYIRGLQKVLDVEENIVLQVKDNFGLLKAILGFIKKNNLRKRVYVQYHYHSFFPFSYDEALLEQIDELTLLSEYTYTTIKNMVNSLPVRVSINTDGVDSKVFKRVDNDEKKKLRKKYKISNDKLVFIWCSQNRKKKGLDLTLLIWESLLKKYKDKIELLIFGVNIEKKLPQIRMMGMMINSELVEYYQLSDFYLFPTLWQEGFGLSLVEALKCGSYCIASSNGAVPLVLANGKYGKLIDSPHLVEEWVLEIHKSIEDYITGGRTNKYLENIPENIYDMNDWYKRYNFQIEQAKIAFEHRYYI